MPRAFLYPMLITQLIDAGQLNKVKTNKNGSCIPVNSSCRDGDYIFYKSRNVTHACKSTLVVERMVYEHLLLGTRLCLCFPMQTLVCSYLRNYVICYFVGLLLIFSFLWPVGTFEAGSVLSL